MSRRSGSKGPERFALGLLLVVVAAAVVGLLVGAGGGANASGPADAPPASVVLAKFAKLKALPAPRSIVFLVNPSPLAEQLALAHLKQLIRTITTPRLMAVALWEQRSADDGMPFNRPLFSELSPLPGAPPRTTPRADCSTGTDFHRSACKRQRAQDYASDLAALTTWRSHWEHGTVRWANGLIGTVAAIEADPPTETVRNNQWDLREGLLRTGQVFEARPATVRCVVTLGGLLVRMPPKVLPAGLLSGTTIVAAGWRGTERQKEAWRVALAGHGITLDFIPATVTDALLVSHVRSCLGEAA
jgi:hypothetical protein